MKSLTVVSILASLYLTLSFSQNIQVLEERKLDLKLENMILVENHLAINPLDSTHLLLSGMYVNSKNTTEYGNFAAVSFNNGKTWKAPHIFDVQEGADPWGLISKNGTALSAVLGLENLYLYRSENGGANWQESPANLGRGHDHQTLIEDIVSGAIYCVSIQGNTIYVNYSLDDGRTFNNPNLFKFSNLGSNTMTPVLLSDGTLLISFTTFNRPAIEGSRNGGKSERLLNNLSWSIPFNIKTGFGTPLFISEVCETGFPVLAKDASTSKFNGNLYYVCSSQSERSIVFHYSNTEGQSWSAGIPIATYTEAETTLRNPFTGMPQITVNNQGTIGVIWQDRSEDEDGKCQYLYFTASLDGGKSFAKPRKISSDISCMEKEENGWAGLRYKSGGDYTGFISDKNGDFIVVWPDSRGRFSQLYMARISVQ